jgi:hypothetical protein
MPKSDKTLISDLKIETSSRDKSETEIEDRENITKRERKCQNLEGGGVRIGGGIITAGARDETETRRSWRSSHDWFLQEEEEEEEEEDRFIFLLDQ